MKLCYSFCAATIFYFFNQHLPKEERKVKAYRFINNKVSELYHETSLLLRNLNIDTRDKLKEISIETVTLACLNINPQNPLLSKDESVTRFADWFEYLNYKSKRIKEIIRDLILLNESIDSELMEQLLTIEDIAYHHLFFDKRRFGITVSRVD